MPIRHLFSCYKVFSITEVHKQYTQEKCHIVGSEMMIGKSGIKHPIMHI